MVYGLQTLSALLMTMYQRASQDSNLNIKTILIGSDNSADAKMQKLFEHCTTILSGIFFILNICVFPYNLDLVSFNLFFLDCTEICLKLVYVNWPTCQFQK